MSKLTPAAVHLHYDTALRRPHSLYRVEREPQVDRTLRRQERR
jgi:hypothetical protein